MNSKILRVLSSTRLTAALLFSLLTLVVAQTSADEINSAFPKSAATVVDSANTLPELGTPAANSASVQPNINAQGAGFNYRDKINGKLISINPQYTEQGGAAIGGSFSTPIAKNMAVGILLTVGSDKNEWLLNTGFDLTSNQRFIFSVGQLRQKLDFNFISGKQKAQVTQNNVAGSYQYFLGKDWLNAAEVNAYLSDTGSVNLGAKTYFTDTTSLYELWSDPRRIAGGRVSGVQGRLVFTPTSKSTLKLGFGGERLTYDLLTGNDSTTRATGSAEFNQRLDHGFNFRASANAGASQSRYALGLGKSFIGGSQLGLDVATIQGRDKAFNDNQLLLSFTQSFGGSAYAGNSLGMNNPALNNNALSNLDAAGVPMNPAPVNMAAPNPTATNWASSLVDQVSRRPSFLPAQVIAKIDTTATPTRLIAIDKTAVPVGSSINTATGVIAAPTGTPVSVIDHVTKNALAFTNAGQFALSGTGLLVVNPNLITQPAVGVIDTYIVTMINSSGFGTTLATVVVSHGSTKIDSIVMSDGTITPSLTDFVAISKTYRDAAFGLTAPTTASSGAFTYTSSNTAVATISGSTVTVVGVGTSTITVTQAANGNYATASTTATLTVTAATPSLTGFNAISKTYGDAAFSLSTPTSASAGAFTYTSSNTAVATISGSTVTVVGAGTSTITATQAANGNYATASTTATLTVTAATPSLSGLGLSASSVVFGATVPTITAPTSASSGAITYTSGTVGTATIDSTTGVVTIVGVGTTVINATQAANGNYASSTKTITLTVTGAAPIFTTAFALSSSSVVFGTTTMPTITAPSSASSGAITYTVTTGGTSTTPAVISSTGVIITIGSVGTTIFTATQAANGNYAASSTTTTLTVTAVRINAAAISGVTAPVTGATPVSSVTGTGYTGTVAWNGNPTAFAYNTTYTATITLTATAGYTLTGVTANYFTVAGTSSAASNAANAGVVTAAFPATVLPAGFIITQTLGTAGTIVNTYDTTSQLNGGGTLIWSQKDTTFVIRGYEAAAYCNAMSALGYSSGWRVPTQQEFSGLHNTNSSALSSAGWSLSSLTWSATVGPGFGDPYAVYVYVVRLSDGYVFSGNSDNYFYVSCVHENL